MDGAGRGRDKLLKALVRKPRKVIKGLVKVIKGLVRKPRKGYGSMAHEAKPNGLLARGP